MGKIGRIIDDHDYVHAADWYSMLFAATGAGYLLDGGSPSKTASYEVTVGSGTVCLGLPDVKNYTGETLTLSSHGVSGKRYDLIYLYWNSTSSAIEAGVIEGTAGTAKHGTVPEGSIPIAVAYFESGATEITELKDCRTVIDPEHNHSAGTALELDADSRMNVKADEETVTVTNDVVEVKEIGTGELSLVWGDGVWLEEGVGEDNDDIVHIDVGHGLGFDTVDETEKIVVTPTDLPGAGIEETDGDLNVEASRGLHIVSNRVTVNDGDGVILRGSTPDRSVEVYHLPGGGLNLESGEVVVVPDDIDGPGLNTESGSLHVEAGNGLTIDSTGTTIDEGRGIDVGSDQIDIEIQDGGGLEFDADDRLKADLAGKAGDGLTVQDNSILHVNGGDGIAVGAETAIDSYLGTRLNNPGGEADGDYLLEAHLSPDGGIEFDSYDRMKVKAADLTGTGITEESGYLKITPGDGMGITSGALSVNAGQGLKVPDAAGGALTVDLDAISGYGTLVDSENENIKMDPSIFFELHDEYEVTMEPDDVSGAFTIQDEPYYPILVTHTILSDGSTDPITHGKLKSYIGFRNKAGYVVTWKYNESDEELTCLERVYINKIAGGWSSA